MPTIHRHIDIDGVTLFYRETRPTRPDAPVLLLLHGFPTASHQFTRLMDALGDDYRLIAPDYPGFGNTTAPDDFAYTFDTLADTVEAFVEAIGLDRFAMYVFDFGAPVGFRLAQRRPDRVTGLVVQNGNAYTEGLTRAAQDFIALRPEDPKAETAIRGLLTLEGTRGQYLTGTRAPEHVSPDGWTLDQHFLDLPGRKEAQIALAFDYHSNVERYPAWQEWLRTRRPPALVLWGTGDPFFSADGARAYLRDLPDAELRLYDTGHFALEEDLAGIAGEIGAFLGKLGSE
ncbi:alpha/beta fold hydrolase [Phytomonospora endophytica]|uniref:Pimeloyl-ACP methyl ester carboxylesterase n=1 Tax=Phytomonospora endophytica TaxID=714109 RepID=A0A841FIT9_9ACTN|nr:alpha/beta hydrolase [Phytomonospora endophytica]MBB6034863.1 pimeloyl-ACP methyl ester carboxylesterase [Phytomonospora endophytica]GIG70566.1 hydrolase [Phytomonospora endophytica]